MLVDVIFEGVHYDKYKFDLVNNIVIGYHYPNKPRILNPWINKTKSRTTGNVYYRKIVDLTLNDKKKHIKLHRLVYQLNNPTQDITGLEVDHIDQNSLNNDITNLRLVTASQNNANISKLKKNNGKETTSKYIGISYDKRDDIWQSQIKVEKKMYSKLFKNEREALEWRNNKIVELKVEEYYVIQPWIKKQVIIKKK
jgi:hypothetical protein